jgi:hypothetical protein
MNGLGLNAVRMRWFGYLKRTAAFMAGLAVGLFLIGLAAYLIGYN